MRARLTLRTLPSKNLPVVVAGGMPDVGKKQDRLTWLKIIAAYTTRLPSDLDNEKKWPLLPEGIKRTDAGKVLENEDLRRKLAVDAVNEWFSEEIFARSLAQIKGALRRNPGKFTEVKIVYPAPIKNEYSENYVPAAFADKLEERLKEHDLGVPVRFLNKRRPGINPFDEGLYIVAKGSRGVPKTDEIDQDGHKRFNYAVQRVSRQICVAGKVEKDALYWIIDDGVTAGGTLANYYNHIHNMAGNVGSLTTLSKRSSGAEILAAQPESIEFLFATLKHLAALKASWIFQPDEYDGIKGADKYQSDLKSHARETKWRTRDHCNSLHSLLLELGLHLKLWDQVDSGQLTTNLHKAVQSTTLTNQEILLLGAYFMDPKEQELWVVLERALNKIGTSARTSQGSYVVKVANLPLGGLVELRHMMHYAQKDRKDLCEFIHGELTAQHLPGNRIATFQNFLWTEQWNGFVSVQHEEWDR